MRLYEIDKELLSLVDEETGEIADWDRFEELQMERDAKIENVALWIKNLTAEAEACKKEKLAFAERQSSCEKRAKNLKEWLKEALNCKNYKSEDGRAEIRFRKTTSVAIEEGTILPPAYLRYKDPEPDKAALKEALKAGTEIQGVSLESGMSVVIR